MADSSTSESRPLRVALLAHALRVAGGLSVGRNMIAAFGRVAPQHRYWITIPPGLGYEQICEAIPHCETVAVARRAGRLGRWMFDTFRLPGLVRDFRPDVLFAMGGKGLLRPPCPQAALCHDSHMFYPVTHYEHETLKRRLIKRYLKHHLRRQLSRTQLVFCQTSAARDRLREEFNYEGRMAICPNAVPEFPPADRPLKPPAPLEAHQGKFRLFYVTKFYAHKNLEAFVDLFDRFRDELADVVAFVTVSADQHPNAPRFLKSIVARGVQDHVINLGPVPQPDLPAYYQNADALLMPTLLESFSATYLEAMHFDLPILTSDLDFAHAVCGPAALYFDPWDVASIKDAVVRLRDDPELRHELVERGRQRVKEVLRSWDDVARNALKALKEIVDTPQMAEGPWQGNRSR